MTAEKLIQKQLDAYNKHDLDEFVVLFDENVEIYNFPNELQMKGREALRKFYKEERFHLPKLHAHLNKRIVMKNKVIDHETITGLKEEAIEIIAIYQVSDNVITKIWFIR